VDDRILTFEFVTPCFLGGASREGPAEWRAGSVRGQLRWWFRAVAGGRYDGDLQQVRKLEAEIFGTTDRSSSLRVRTLGTPQTFPAGTPCTAGRSLGAEEIAAMWADSSAGTVSRLRLLSPGGKAFPVNPIHYLAYGPVDRGRFVRSGIPPEEKARLLLQWRRPPGEEAGKLFDLALRSWLNLGGIGARSRKGFGSLRCLEVHRGTVRDDEATDELSPRNADAFRR